MRLWKSVLACTVAVVGFAGRGSLVQRASAPDSRLTNPFGGNEAARRAGAKLYGRECAPCHGARREGIGKAPPLDRTDIYRAEPGALFWVLRNGSLRDGMPSFAHLPEPERWQIVTFLTEMRQTARIR
jgi:mono/diheme cytochrome c family protein